MDTTELTTSLRETLGVFEGVADACEPLTTNEVTEHLDVGRRSTYERLQRLTDQEHLRTKKVGARGRVWWQPPAGTRLDTGETEGEDGDLQGFAKVARDMTDRHEYEKELRRQRDFTREILETTPVGVIVVDPDGTFETKNRRADELLGIDADDPSTVGINEVFDEDGEYLPPEQRPYVRVFETGESIRNVHLAVPTSDGGRRWLSTNVEPVPGGGSVERAIVTVQDVTQLKGQAKQLERRRDELERELEDVFERVDDAFFAVDDDWRFTYVNEAAAELVHLSAGAMLGTRVWDTLPEVSEGYLHTVVERAMKTQESAEFEFYSEILEIWIEARLYPSEDGLSVYFRDVTDRVERERELEAYETIVSTMKDGVYVVDEDYHFELVNEAYEEMTGYDREELLGTHCSLVGSEETTAQSAEQVEEILAGVDSSVRLEADIHRKDGSTLRAESNFTAVSGSDGETDRKVSVVRDVEERVQREREIEESRQRLQTLVEQFPNGAVTLVNDDLRYVTVGGTPLKYADRTIEELEDERVDEILPTALADLLIPRYVAALDGESSSFVHDFGDRSTHFRIVPVRDEEDGNVFGALGMSQDITAQKEHERELEKRLRQQQVVADLGQDALETRNLDGLMDKAARLVADVLDNDYCKVLDLDDTDEKLLLRQGVGWQDGIVGEATVSATENDSQGAYTLSVDKPVVVEDLHVETRFSGPDLLRNHDVRSGISVIIGTADEPWGILGTHDTSPKNVSEDDVRFVQAVANILATAIERHRYEEELVQQREELEALNSLNEVIQDITSAVVDQSTRGEIEEAVVEGLAEADSFSFAWIGEADGASREVTLRTEAGLEGSLDESPITTAPDDDRSSGPTAQALHTGEVQVVQDVRSKPGFGPWPDHAEDDDFQSSAAIPIVHEGTVYGVLNVYDDRPHAFADAERQVLTQLGESVGHAIAAVERKRALMSDEVIELELRIPNVLQAHGIDVDDAGHISLDQAIPVDEGRYLVYGTANEAGRAALDEIVATLPEWESIQDTSTRGDRHRFEATLTEPPVLTAVASRGGYVDEAVIEDGEFHLVIHLPPTVNRWSIIDTVTDKYPMADLVAQRQFSRTEETGVRFEQLLYDEFTERQRTAVKAAYHLGYFEWPRESDGGAVADSLGVSPPTFHQHLRKAEAKVFETLLNGPVSSDEEATA